MSNQIQTDFLSSLPKITNKLTPTIDQASYIPSTNGGLTVDIPQTNSAINNFFLQPQTYPRSLAGFHSALRATFPSLPTDPLQGPTYQTALAQLNLLINPADITALTGIGITMQTITLNALDHFFKNFKSTDVGGLGGSLNYTTNFQTLLAKYLTKTSEIQSTVSNFMSYQQLFNAFIGGTNAQFNGAFLDFYNRMTNKHGYFLPSQMLSQWIGELNTRINPTAVINLGTGSEKTQIIFELLALVSQMIGTLQDVSTAQVQRLTFYANWQQAYTTLISKIPVVTFSDLKGRTTAEKNDSIITATQAIGSINQTYTEQAQGWRDSVSDETKSHQSAVDQTKEALNAQSSLATTLLQNLSTILQSIFG